MHAIVSKEPVFCDKYWCIKHSRSVNVYLEFSIFVSHSWGIFSFVVWVRAVSSWEWLKWSGSAVPRHCSLWGQSFILRHSDDYHTNKYVHEVGFLSCSISDLPRTGQRHKPEGHVEFPALMSSWVEGYNLRHGWLFCHEDWSIGKVLTPHLVCFWVSNALLPWGSRRHCIFLQQISFLNILFFLEWVSTPVK